MGAGNILGQPGTWELVARLMTAGLLGGLIGAEREYRAKVAGTRTHLLVAIGAALMMIVSKYGFDDLPDSFDPARIAAQVVTGIGFVGAGIIFRVGNSLKGLSTAAGIWATAGIGLAIGAGLYLPAAIATVLVVLVQSLFHRVLIGNDAYHDNAVTVVFRDSEPNRIGEMIASLEKEKKINVITRSIQKENGEILRKLSFVYRSGFDQEDFERTLAKDESVVSIQ